MLLSLFLQALYIGSEWAVVAVGFGLIARTCNLFHLAIGSLFSLGSYLLYWLVARHSFGLLPGVLIATVSAGLTGAAVDRLVYQPVTGLSGQKRYNHLAPFVASLGVLIVLRNALQLGFSASPISLPLPSLGIVAIGGAHVLGWYLMRAVISLAAILLLWLWLRFTRAGISTVALGQSAEGATVVGISERTVRFQLFFATGMLAGLGGALSVLSRPVMPGDGFPIVLYGSLVSLLLPNRGPLTWWAAAVCAALIFGIGVATIGRGWEDTLLQVVLLSGIVLTRVVLPRLAGIRVLQRAPHTPRFASEVPPVV